MIMMFTTERDADCVPESIDLLTVLMSSSLYRSALKGNADQNGLSHHKKDIVIKTRQSVPYYALLTYMRF